ncbi:Unknown protein sequence [Pseudomonas syringae pv. maculicola]|nr:Unknown protein sequence [Pseudomonas syringae pv. maculicola]
MGPLHRSSQPSQPLKLIQPFGQKPSQDVSQDLRIKRRGIS